MTDLILVQNESNAPAVEQWKRIMKCVPRFTEADAIKAVNENYGILLRRLDQSEAGALQAAFE